MAFPFKNILCPIDLEDGSVLGLETAANVARQTGGTISVLHVLPALSTASEPEIDVELYKAQDEAARAKMQDLTAKHLAGVSYQLLTHLGDPAGAILASEKKISADLIVLVTHGRKGLSRLFSGSVAEQVQRESKCPVLSMKEPPK